MIELAPSTAIPEDVAGLYKDTSGIVSAVAWALYDHLHTVPYLPMVELDSMHPDAHDTSTEGNYTRLIPTLEDTEVYGYKRVYPDSASIEFWRNRRGRRQNEVATWLYAPTDFNRDEAPATEERRESSDLLGIANSGLVYVNDRQVRLGTGIPRLGENGAAPQSPVDLLCTDAQAILVAACVLEATCSGWDFNTHYARDLRAQLADQYGALAQHPLSDIGEPYGVGQIRSEVLGTKFIHQRAISS